MDMVDKQQGRIPPNSPRETALDGQAPEMFESRLTWAQENMFNSVPLAWGWVAVTKTSS